MPITLSSDLENLIASKVQNGQYPSANEVIREALQLLEDRDRSCQAELAELAELQRDIAMGIEQLNRGEGGALDEQVVERIKAEGRKRLAEKLAKDSS